MQPRSSDSDYDYPIILEGDNALMGEEAGDVRRGVELGLLVNCPHGVTVPGRLPYQQEQLPCGFVHGRGGFFHVADGHTIDEYLEQR